MRKSILAVLGAALTVPLLAMKMRKIAIVTAALVLPALWSAPAASADTIMDGYYFPHPHNGTLSVSAHWDIYGTPGQDLSRPTSTVTMGNGCTMDWYGEGSDRTLNNGDVHVFMHGHVTSGASDSCRDSTRLSELISEHDGSVAVNVTDLDNAVGWEFTK